MQNSLFSQSALIDIQEGDRYIYIHIEIFYSQGESLDNR